MGVSTFKILAEAEAAFNINDLFLSPGLDLLDTPKNTVQVIQVQIETDQASVLEVTTTGGTTWSKLNNATAVDGMATFTMMLRQADELNFRNTDVAGLLVKITVAG